MKGLIMKCVRYVGLTFLLLLFFINNNVQGLKILSIFPVPSRSHLILGQSLLKGLAEAGHEVTMISPIPLEKPFKNYRDIVLDVAMEDLMDSGLVQNKFDLFKNQNKNPISAIQTIFNIGLKLTEKTIQDKSVQKLLTSHEEKFDAVIVEVFLDEGLYAIAHHFNAPLIVLSPTSANSWTDSLVGNVAPFAAVPDLITGFSDHMTFTERMINTCISTFNLLLRHYWYIPKQAELVKKYFKNAPPLEDIMYNTSLLLINSHVSTTYPRSLTQNVQEIGGFHITDPKPLPDDLQKFLDNSPQGVIYFSMGSNLRSADLSPETYNAFLKAFGKLKQNVLWKWEDKNLPNKPDNLKIKEWFPQRDILAHPNVKMFITHGGMLSTTEAIMNGVPVIGIPIFGDQKMNMGKAAKMEYGLLLEFGNLTEVSISWAINEMLTNSKYTENIKTRSNILRDQQTKPLQRAIYWIEYVVRHKGAHHLRSITTGMPIYKYLLLDVIALILTVLVISVSITVFTIKKLYRIIFSKKNKTKIDQKKRN